MFDKTLFTYNSRDALGTALSLPALLADLEEARLTHFYQNLVMPLARVIVKLNLNGFYIDQKARQKAIDTTNEDIENLQNVLDVAVGHPVKVNGNDVPELLFNELGLPCLHKTPTGRPKKDEAVLRKLADLEPDVADVISLILTIREKQKFVSTFLEGLEVSADGRVYPSYRIGPATGRLACRNPNMQNVPKYDELPNGETRPSIARRMFVAPPGKVLVYADFKQLELRIIAILANDEPFLQVFKEGRDPHEYNARGLFSVPPNGSISPKQRDFAKRFQYALNYGGGTDTVREKGIELFHDVAEELMEQLEERYFAAHPAILVYRKQIEYELRTKRCLVNEFGRPRIFFQTFREALRQAYNNPMQSNAADIVNTKTIGLDSIMPGALCHQGHDSLIYEVDENKAEEAARILKEVLEKPVPEMRGYSFPADTKIGKSWGGF